MKNLKKPTIIIAATIAVIFLIIWSLDAFGFRVPIFAFLVNWLAMSWIVVLGQIVHLSFPSRYYDIKSFEQTGRIYERLGIRFFKNLVRRGSLSIFSPTLRFPKERTIPALQRLEQEMRNAETGHVLIFTLILLVVIYALLRGCLDAAGWMLLFDVIINSYPIMLQ